MECFAVLVETILEFHYCLISFLVNYFGILKIDTITIVDNFQISISTLLFMFS